MWYSRLVPTGSGCYRIQREPVFLATRLLCTQDIWLFTHVTLHNTTLSKDDVWCKIRYEYSNTTPWLTVKSPISAILVALLVDGSRAPPRGVAVTLDLLFKWTSSSELKLLWRSSCCPNERCQTTPDEQNVSHHSVLLQNRTLPGNLDSPSLGIHWQGYRECTRLSPLLSPKPPNPACSWCSPSQC